MFGLGILQEGVDFGGYEKIVLQCGLICANNTVNSNAYNTDGQILHKT